MKPFETIVIQHLSNAGAPSSTMLVKIPATISESNAMVELLKRIRHDYPGAWHVAQQWERQQYHGPITVVQQKQEMKTTMKGVKEVTREHLGLPPINDQFEDVPV